MGFLHVRMNGCLCCCTWLILAEPKHVLESRNSTSMRRCEVDSESTQEYTHTFCNTFLLRVI